MCIAWTAREHNNDVLLLRGVGHGRSRVADLRNWADTSSIVLSTDRLDVAVILHVAVVLKVPALAAAADGAGPVAAGGRTDIVCIEADHGNGSAVLPLLIEDGLVGRAFVNSHSLGRAGILLIIHLLDGLDIDEAATRSRERLRLVAQREPGDSLLPGSVRARGRSEATYAFLVLVLSDLRSRARRAGDVPVRK